MAVNNFYDSLNLQTVEGTETFIKLEKKLRDNHWYKPMLDQAEVSLNVNRVYLVLGASSVFLVGLLLQHGVSLIMSGFGFIYPLYQTVASCIGVMHLRREMALTLSTTMQFDPSSVQQTRNTRRLRHIPFTQTAWKHCPVLEYPHHIIAKECSSKEGFRIVFYT
ncbi:uncharacterized protein [Parasteatoda tepidariorum]|uniref:uncharacterized protein isoform X2 n=1 Tax=Parasteatoda tepidariorum TaxID=114398 RepID=UPI001C724AAB|nr:uncharacterized protein LOC107441407 isoform X2 [Parasteatoda tepidariorum]